VTTDASHAVSLQAWAAEAEAAAVIARALAPTPFIPEQLRRYLNPDVRDKRELKLDYEGTVATVMAVFLAGQELGFGPMASLRAITVIKGTVGLYALAARALLQQHGHEIVVKDSTSIRAVVDGRRAGGEWMRSIWDIDRATRARLLPGADNSNWRTQTKAMLVARATAEVARWVASDAMLGLPLLAEEIEDGPEVNGQMLAIESAATGPPGPAPGKELDPPPPAGATKTPTKRKTTVKRAALPTAGDDRPPPAPPEPPPPAQPPAAVPAEVEPPAEKLPPQTRAKILAGLREMHITGREESLALISAWVGRQVDSTNDLSQNEAHVVIERTEALLNLGATKVEPADEETPDPPPDDDDQPPPPPPDDQLEGA
jgi:hypothetical protein